MVVAGLLERADDGRRVRNTVVAVAGDGIRAVYRKLHLYDAFGQRESDWVEPGEIAPPQTFETAGLRFGLMTCYDLRFPEVARTLADAAVDVALIPAEWVRGPLKEHHWRTLVQAGRSRTRSSSPPPTTRHRSGSVTRWSSTRRGSRWPRSARRPTSRSPTSIRMPSPACGASTPRWRSAVPRHAALT